MNFSKLLPGCCELWHWKVSAKYCQNNFSKIFELHRVRRNFVDGTTIFLLFNIAKNFCDWRREKFVFGNSIKVSCQKVLSYFASILIFPSENICDFLSFRLDFTWFSGWWGKLCMNGREWQYLRKNLLREVNDVSWIKYKELFFSSKFYCWMMREKVFKLELWVVLVCFKRASVGNK